MDRRGAFEAVALAEDRVDDVDLDGGIRAEVLDRLRRRDLGEDEMLVVPDRGRPLRREVRRPVRADRRNEAEALLSDELLHLLGENAQADSMLENRGRG